MGSYAQTVAPTSLAVSLDEVKQHCAVAGITDHDAYLASLIEVATATVEARTTRQIMPATWTLTLEGFPAEIRIHKPPVSAISSVQYYDEDEDLQTLSTDDYQTDYVSDDRAARIKPIDGVAWPTTASGTYGAVVVTFTTGYSSATEVPAILRHAIKFLVAHWFAMREPVTFGATTSIPEGLGMLLGLGDWGCYL